MFKALGAALILMAGAGSASGATDRLEGDLLPRGLNGAGTCTSSTYFFELPAKDPGTKPGVAFRTLMLGRIPADVLTAIERVTITVDEARKIPWVSVELRTGRHHTELHISSTDLQAAQCLAKARRS